MSAVLSTVLFASAAAAQITTSLWLPASFDTPEDTQFHASVVGAEGDDVVTLAIAISGDGYDEDSAYVDTITYSGSTAFESVTTISDFDSEFEGDMTMSYGCSKDGNTPVCAYSSNGPALWSSICADFSDYTSVLVTTETYTFDSPSSVVEQVTTEDYSDMVPDFCLTGSLLPESLALESVSMRESSTREYPVTITAGEKLLDATAGATPTDSLASSTGSVKPTASPSGGNSTASVSAPTGSTPSPSGPPAQETNAAGRMATLAPALAGFGALVAVFL